MKLTFTCDCGHSNKWDIPTQKISNFICERCGTFIGASNAHEVRFSPNMKDEIRYDYSHEEINVRRVPRNVVQYFYRSPYYVSDSTTDATTSNYYVTSYTGNSTW